MFSTLFVLSAHHVTVTVEEEILLDLRGVGWQLLRPAARVAASRRWLVLTLGRRRRIAGRTDRRTKNLRRCQRKRRTDGRRNEILASLRLGLAHLARRLSPLLHPPRNTVRPSMWIYLPCCCFGMRGEGGGVNMPELRSRVPSAIQAAFASVLGLSIVVLQIFPVFLHLQCRCPSSNLECFSIRSFGP